MSEHETETQDLEDEIAEELTPDDDETPEPVDEQPESEPEEEPEPDTDPESEARIEEIGKKLDGLKKHVARRMGEILGDDAQYYVECELCSWANTPGWRPPMEPPAEVQAALLNLLGYHAPTDYLPDGYTHVCERCNGLGEVSTGSKVQGQERLVCLDCQGRGWADVGRTEKSKGALFPNGPQPPAPRPTRESAVSVVAGEPDPPEVQALKERGYVIIPPMEPVS